MKNTKLAFCKFSKYPILKSIRVKFSRYKQKSMNVSVSFDTLIVIGNSEEFPITQKALTRQWCAPARRCRLSQATARDKRMCQGVVYFYDWKIQKVPYGTETYYKKTHYNRKRSRTKSVATRITALKFH